MDKQAAIPPQRVVRLLIPIDAGPKATWGVSYALKVAEAGQAVEAIFLNVGEYITDWRVKQYKTDKEIEAFQVERAEVFISDACKPLLEKGIPCRGIFKQGEVVRSIIDTADELACDEVILPRSDPAWWKLFARNVTHRVCDQYRKGLVVLVDQAGTVSAG